MDDYQVMYQFQHKLMPSWFYEEPKEFVGVNCMQNTALYEILSEMFRRAGLDNPYSPGQFSVESGEVNENIGMLRIKFPKAQEEHLCHGAICFFDKGFKYTGYFTIEKGKDVDEAFPVLCSWSKEGEHFGYGKVSPDPDEQLMECISVFMGKYSEAIASEYSGQEKE